MEAILLQGVDTWVCVMEQQELAKYTQDFEVRALPRVRLLRQHAR